MTFGDILKLNTHSLPATCPQYNYSTAVASHGEKFKPYGLKHDHSAPGSMLEIVSLSPFQLRND